MELSLRQALSYLALSGCEQETLIKAWEQHFNLPCKDRREGKEILRKIEEEIRAIPLPLHPLAEQKGHEKKSRPVERILIERGVLHHPRAERILSHFPAVGVEEITHYKDIFRRSTDGRCTLILAEKKGKLLYPGAPVCQNFGNRYFFYASQIMNCIFDCEYCYLKGMYPSDAMVVFLNLEDYFEELRELLSEHPVYLCLSYDTDLLALEAWTSFLHEWSGFIKEHPSLSVEIRTKSAYTGFYEKGKPLENLIFAYTLSPKSIVSTYEFGAPSLSSRLAAVKKAMEKGFPVRLCFDPVLYCEDWQTIYGVFLDEVMETVDFGRVKDVSAGVFRIPHPYLRQMRKQMPHSAAAQYPYRNEGGVACYETALEEEIRQFFIQKLTKKIGNDKIFWWKTQGNCDKVDT